MMQAVILCGRNSRVL